MGRAAAAIVAGAHAAGPRKGSITVKCAGHGLWYTTYHLNFVVVPATVRADKRAGEPVLVDLERRGAEIALVGVR